MPILIGTRKALLYAGGIPWLLNDSFNDTLAAGSVNGTAATPGPGTRVVDDTSTNLSLSGGNAVIAGGESGDYGEPGLWLDAVTRAAGVVGVMSYTGASGAIGRVGFDSTQAEGGKSGNAYHVESVTDLRAYKGSGSALAVATIVATTEYYLAIVLKASGAYYFIKNGAFSNWTLLWVYAQPSTATQYLGIMNYSLVYNSSFLRVPVETWLPTPLAYDTFTDTNGVSLDAHASDTSGPDSQATASRAWTEESGDWDIQSNKANPDGAAIATIDAGQADVVVDLTVDGGTAGQPAICLRFADTNNYWFLQADRANNQLELHEYASGDTVRANAAVTFNDSTDYDLRAICDGQKIDGFADGANKISYASAALNETKTEHGLYADHTECEFDDFLVFARDSGYSTLNKFTR